MIINLIWLTLISVFLVIMMIGYCLQSWKLQAELEQSKSDIDQLRQEIEQMRSDTIPRVDVLSKRYGHLVNRYRSLESQIISNRSYENAIRMVKGGADFGELVDMCGLSPGEAQLVASLHQKNLSKGT